MDDEGGAAVRFMSVRELRSQSAKLWETLKESGEVVVTSNGRPVALLSPLDEELAKLWRHPHVRREVVAQIIGNANPVATW